MEDHALNLVKTLLSFQERSLFCDTVIVTKDQLVFAHSAVLAATCPAMFSLLNQQPFNNQKTNIIQLERFDSDLIKDLLGFFYTGQVEAQRTSELKEVCKMLGIMLNLSTASEPVHVSILSDVPDLGANSELDPDVVNEDGAHKNTVQARPMRSPSHMLGLGSEDGIEGTAGQMPNIKPVARRRKTAGLRATRSNTSDVKSGSTESSTTKAGTSPIIKPQESVENSVPGKQTELRNNDFLHLQSEKNCTVMGAVGNDKQSNFVAAGLKSKSSHYICSLCEALFQTQRALNIHKYSHNAMDDGTYQCHICSKIFSLREYLRKHVRAHYSRPAAKQAKKYACQACQKHFRTAARLSAHSNTHTGEKPFVCVICSKGYADKEYLSKHQRLHRNERPYLCDDCGMSFVFRQSYTSHRRLHTGEKPYVCSDCNRAFVQPSALRAHLRGHSLTNSFPCSQCPKNFSSAQKLASHIILTHTKTDTQKFQCTVCKKNFEKQYVFLQHLQNHDTVHRCSSCGKTFRCQLKLKQHVKKCFIS